MIKKQFLSKMVLFLIICFISVLFIFNPGLQAQNNRPQRDCCFLIWSTARYLGWSTALFYNTQIRERWVQYDQIMVDQLEGAIKSIEGVERSCSEARWKDCKQKILWLQSLIRSFKGNPTSGNRRSIYNSILNTYKWGYQLKRQVYHYRGQTYDTNFATCAEKYYRLGFSLATAAQLFRHANEHIQYRYDNWRQWYYQNIDSAQSWLKEAQNILNEYNRVVTGRCVQLPVRNYHNYISSIMSKVRKQQNIQSIIQNVENLMNNAGQRLRTQCPGRDSQGSHQETDDFYGISPKSKVVVFVIDISGSMKKGKLKTAKRQVTQTIAKFTSNRYFTIIAFSSGITRWVKKGSLVAKATSQNKQAAYNFINRLSADGGTNIYKAIKAAFSTNLDKNGKPRYKIGEILFMTDGKGKRENELLRNIPSWYRQNPIKVNCVGVGKDVNVNFLQKLANITNGVFRHIR